MVTLRRALAFADAQTAAFAAIASVRGRAEVGAVAALFTSAESVAVALALWDAVLAVATLLG